MNENREVRIAELERERDWLSDKRSERFKAVSYELARLRNEITSAALAQSEAGPTDEEIDRAALAWQSQKPTVGCEDQTQYFRKNWRALPGLERYVRAEIAKRPALAQSDAGPQDVRAILLEMRDITFSVSGKDAQQVEDYFTRRASDALAALAQSDAGPVACSDCKDIERCRDNGRCWISGDGISSSPDASAGLIEAAKIAELYADNCYQYHCKNEGIYIRNFARVLRARADRSGK